MSQKLRQAIVAARAGQKREAQFLLTQVLQEDPEETQAWFLLSHLVDSEEKQMAYLKKVLALDPDHPKAKQRLAQMEKVEPLPVEEGVLDLTQESWDEALPDWLEEEGDESTLDELVATSVSVPEADTAVTAPAEVGEAAAESFPSPTAAEATATVAPTEQPPDTARQRQITRLTITLIGLIAITTIVLIAFLYVVFTAF